MNVNICLKKLRKGVIRGSAVNNVTRRRYCSVQEIYLLMSSPVPFSVRDMFNTSSKCKEKLVFGLAVAPARLSFLPSQGRLIPFTFSSLSVQTWEATSGYAQRKAYLSPLSGMQSNVHNQRPCYHCWGVISLFEVKKYTYICIHIL